MQSDQLPRDTQGLQVSQARLDIYAVPMFLGKTSPTLEPLFLCTCWSVCPCIQLEAQRKEKVHGSMLGRVYLKNEKEWKCQLQLQLPFCHLSFGDEAAGRIVWILTWNIHLRSVDKLRRFVWRESRANEGPGHVQSPLGIAKPSSRRVMHLICFFADLLPWRVVEWMKRKNVRVWGVSVSIHKLPLNSTTTIHIETSLVNVATASDNQSHYKYS